MFFFSLPLKLTWWFDWRLAICREVSRSSSYYSGEESNWTRNGVFQKLLGKEKMTGIYMW